MTTRLLLLVTGGAVILGVIFGGLGLLVGYRGTAASLNIALGAGALFFAAAKVIWVMRRTMRDLLQDEVDALFRVQQAALAEACQENRRLEQQIAEQRRAQEIERVLLYEQSVYWKRAGAGNAVEPDPYCPACWEADRRLAHLQPGSERGSYLCPLDHTEYMVRQPRASVWV